MSLKLKNSQLWLFFEFFSNIFIHACFSFDSLWNIRWIIYIVRLGVHCMGKILNWSTFKNGKENSGNLLQHLKNQLIFFHFPVMQRGKIRILNYLWNFNGTKHCLIFYFILSLHFVVSKVVGGDDKFNSELISNFCFVFFSVKVWLKEVTLKREIVVKKVYKYSQAAEIKLIFMVHSLAFIYVFSFIQFSCHVFLVINIFEIIHELIFLQYCSTLHFFLFLQKVKWTCELENQHL